MYDYFIDKFYINFICMNNLYNYIYKFLLLNDIYDKL